jgi:hypothetical protein
MIKSRLKKMKLVSAPKMSKLSLKKLNKKRRSPKSSKMRKRPRETLERRFFLSKSRRSTTR